MSTTDENIADLTLHFLGRSGFKPFLVVIGAMDGVTFDDFHGHIRMYEWSGLFVEPIPEQFRRLQANYAALSYRPANRYENVAIADHDGTIRMVTIDQEAIDTGRVHPAFGGMSAIDPPRNGLATSADAGIVDRYGVRVEVPCLTLRSLLERHQVDRIDVLCLDAEGWDYRILRQLDFSIYRPKLIRCEYINLSPEEKRDVVRLLTRHGYVFRIHEADIDAVASETWEEMKTAGAATSPPARRPDPGTVTLVTGLFDLSLGERDMRLRRGFARALDEFKRLLAVEWPLVVFAQPEFEELIARYRPRADTRVFARSNADLERFPFYDRVQEIRSRAGAPNHDHPTHKGPEWLLRLYDPFAMSKPFFLHDASIHDPFGTEAFLWVDADIARDLGDPVAVFTDGFRRSFTDLVRDDRMLYFSRPWAGRPEAPGYSRAQMAELAGEKPSHLVGGRLFGGTGAAVRSINAGYYSHLSWSFERGYMGTEEHVLTLLSYTHRHLMHLRKLGPDERMLGALEGIARTREGAR